MSGSRRGSIDRRRTSGGGGLPPPVFAQVSQLELDRFALQLRRTRVQFRLVVMELGELGTRLGIGLRFGLPLAPGRVGDPGLGAFLPTQCPALGDVVRIHTTKSTPIRCPFTASARAKYPSDAAMRPGPAPPGHRRA